MVIRILDIVPGANTSDEGARVFAVLRKALSANGPVVASFDGIQTATSWDTVAQLASWTVAAFQAPDVRAKLAAVGLFPVGLCRADFTAYLRKQYDEYAPGPLRLCEDLRIRH